MSTELISVVHIYFLGIILARSIFFTEQSVHMSQIEPCPCAARLGERQATVFTPISASSNCPSSVAKTELAMSSGLVHLRERRKHEGANRRR